MKSLEGTRNEYTGKYITEESVVFEGRYSPVNNMKLSNKTTPEEAVKMLQEMQGVDVYAKKDIPEHLHYKSHPNIGDLLLISKGEVVFRPLSISTEANCILM